MSTNIETFVVLDGEKEVPFKGRRLASALAPTKEGWWEQFTLYKTANRRYVVQEEYRTELPGAVESSQISVYDTTKELFEELLKKEPIGVDLLRELVLGALEKNGD